MNIILNNRPESFDLEEMTVEQMLEIKKFSFRMRVIKINGRFIRKNDYSTAVIRDGDEVQMLYLMSGG
jgi:thiamine biosynthesis protein ThiS